MNRGSGDVLTVTMADQRAGRPRQSISRWLFAAVMAAALAVAAIAGMSLAILAGARIWIGESDWTAVVQAHGRVQLWAFAAMLVIGLAPEFLARFNGAGLPAPRWRLVPAALVGGGGLLGALSAPVGGGGDVIGLAAAAMIFAGSVGFAWALSRIRPMWPLREDLHPLAFRAGAAWLVVAAVLLLRGALDTTEGIFPGAETRAMHETLLRGFILSIVVGVTFRALPGHAGTRPLQARQQAVVLVLLHAGLLLWLAGSGVAGFDSERAPRAGNALTAAGVLVYTWMTGILGRREVRDPDLVNVLIRVAWAGAVAWSLLLLWWAADPGSVTAYREGAIRHTMLLGFMAPLILAFAQIVLARFGYGAVARRELLTAGFVLVVAAWPPRVAAGLLFTPDEAPSRALMGVAGIGVMLGLGLGAAAAASTAAALRRAAG